ALSFAEGTVTLMDRGSTNGTHVAQRVLAEPVETAAPPPTPRPEARRAAPEPFVMDDLPLVKAPEPRAQLGPLERNTPLELPGDRHVIEVGQNGGSRVTIERQPNGRVKVESSEGGTMYLRPGQELTVGRKGGNDRIEIADRDISRDHLKVT